MAELLLLCKDLMFASKVAGVARATGVPSKTVPGCGGLEKYAESPPRMVIVDLGMPGLQTAELAETCRALFPACRLIGFAPHVHGELLEAARAAQFDDVLTRGQLNSQVDALIGTLVDDG